MMTYLLWIGLPIAIIILILIFISSREINQKGKEVDNRFLKMEQKYQGFVENYVTNQVLQTDDLTINAESLAKDAFTVILPDLKGILSIVNSTIYDSVTLDTKANYFPNLVGLTEEYFVRSVKNESKMLLPNEEEAYFIAAKEAILSDIKQRLVELQIRR